MNSQVWDVPGAGMPGSGVRGAVWPAPEARGAVLLTHGYGEYMGRYVTYYAGLIPALVSAGFTVYAYDQRGHGATLAASGGRAAVVNLAALVDDHLCAREALRALDIPLFAFGHSMGGLVTAASAARDPRGLRGVILSSPALQVGADEPAPLRRVAALLARVAPAFPVTKLDAAHTSRVPEAVQAYRDDPQNHHGKVPALTAASMLHLSGVLWPEYARWTLPTLVLHGTADRLTDPRGSRRFMETIASTDRTHHEVPGGYHELLNDTGADRVRAVILDWLRQRVRA